ncbi:MAG: hypothetical protein RR922_00180 [Clostridia bacterium]
MSTINNENQDIDSVLDLISNLKTKFTDSTNTAEPLDLLNKNLMLSDFVPSTSADENNKSDYEKVSATDDYAIDLLNAIKPFITPSKQTKLDTYINILSYKKILNIFGGDLFG